MSYNPGNLKPSPGARLHQTTVRDVLMWARNGNDTGRPWRYATPLEIDIFINPESSVTKIKINRNKKCN